MPTSRTERMLDSVMLILYCLWVILNFTVVARLAGVTVAVFSLSIFPIVACLMLWMRVIPPPFMDVAGLRTPVILGYFVLVLIQSLLALAAPASLQSSSLGPFSALECLSIASVVLYDLLLIVALAGSALTRLWVSA